MLQFGPYNDKQNSKEGAQNDTLPPTQHEAHSTQHLILKIMLSRLRNQTVAVDKYWEIE